MLTTPISIVDTHSLSDPLAWYLPKTKYMKLHLRSPFEKVSFNLNLRAKYIDTSKTKLVYNLLT